MRQNIILIGPQGAGKSTIAGILSTQLGMPRCPMDNVRFKYYQEIGYDRNVENRIRNEIGFIGVYAYWKKYEAYAVERVLQDYQGHIIDFGAGHSVYENDDLFESVSSALKPYENVILLMPSADLQESEEILNDRLLAMNQERSIMNKHFLTHHSNKDLAKKIIYTKNKTPQEVCEEIINYINQ